jgi:LysR family transcriptional regulator, nod-box dependent transcriptional activator
MLGIAGSYGKALLRPAKPRIQRYNAPTATGAPAMHFHGLDLNLLVAFDVLLKERSVTRAAARLNITQAGMSGALRKLRDYFDDELLVTSGRRTVLTPRAAALADPVRSALAQIENTITASPRFAPEESERRFEIAATDHVLAVLFARALLALEREAPRMTFALRQGGLDGVQRMERGDVDFIIISDLSVTPAHPSRFLFDDDYVALVSTHNPLCASGLTRESYLAAGHISIQIGDTPYLAFESWLLREHGANRRIEIIAPSFGILPTLVSGSRRIATLNRCHAQSMTLPPDVRILELPFKSPRQSLYLQWHRRSGSDPSILWLAERLVHLAEPLRLGAVT